MKSRFGVPKMLLIKSYYEESWIGEDMSKVK